jgi:hypothetical protein
MALIALAFALLVEATAAPPKGRILSAPPERPDPQARYLIYVHGRAVEGPVRRPNTVFGTYEYDAILERFAAEGFVVISEARAKDTDVFAYAQRLESQVRALLAGGVPAGRVTVVGASKGAVITALASARLSERELAFVALSGCDAGLLRQHDLRLSGRLLSILESSDDVGGTCEPFRVRSAALRAYREITISTGLRHGFLYRPLPEWVEPALAWARREAQARP